MTKPMMLKTSGAHALLDFRSIKQGFGLVYLYHSYPVSVL